MSIYSIEPERPALHGTFSRDYAPILTIQSGESVRFRTLDGGWGLEPGRPFVRKHIKRDGPRDKGHALCGPIAIEGAEPGMTLEIRINEVRTGSWGWSGAGGFNHPNLQWLGLADCEELHLIWELNNKTMVGKSELGHQVALRPFMGVMGMPSAEDVVHTSFIPRPNGGNIDCKELVAGSTLFLPIAVSGGLFSVGDGHAVQGDGESAVPALECPMELVDLTFRVRDDMPITWPRAKTESAWITLGFHEDLNEARMIALSQMLDLMGELFGYDRREALALASLVVDLRITQIVNGIQGVHAVLPHGAIR